jgi:hypothetical protein
MQGKNLLLLRLFDLHGIAFQNFALKYTNLLKDFDKIKSLSRGSDAEKRILRARVYAISTREDIGNKFKFNLGWDGMLLNDEKLIVEKKKIMDDHKNSLTLYDWYDLL